MRTRSSRATAEGSRHETFKPTPRIPSHLSPEATAGMGDFAPDNGYQKKGARRRVPLQIELLLVYAAFL